MSKAKTLAGTVSTGGVLADGQIGVSEITGLQDALDAKQASLVSGTNIKTVNSTTLLGSGDLAVQPTLVSGTNIKTVNSTTLLGSGDLAVQPTLVSGTNIKTIGGASILGSGDVPLPSPAPEFVASGAIASAGLPVSLRNDGTVEVTNGTNNSAVTGSSVGLEDGSTTNATCSIYDPVNNKTVVAFVTNNTTISARVGTVTSTSISLGTAVTMFTGSGLDSVNGCYDPISGKIIFSFKSGSDAVFVVGTVSGNSISFGATSTVTECNAFASITYDAVSQKLVAAIPNTFSNTGRVFLAEVSGTSITLTLAGTFSGTFLQPSIVADTQAGSLVVFYQKSGSESASRVVTLSGGSATFSSELAFDTSGSQGITAVYSSIFGNSIVHANGRIRTCTIVSGNPSFGSPATISTDPSIQRPAIVINEALQRFFIAYRNPTSSPANYGFYATGTAFGGAISLNTPVQIEATLMQFFGAAYDIASRNVVVSFQNQDSSGWGQTRVIQAAGIATNANTFIGFAQSSAANGAAVKVATEGNVDANRTGLSANVKYFINFDGTLSGSPTAYPVAGTALSATRIQVATSPEFAPAATGSLVFLQEVVASSSATVDLTAFSSTYDDYVVMFSGVSLSGIDWFTARLRIGGTYRTASSYHRALHYRRSDDPNYRQEQSTSSNSINLTGQAQSEVYWPIEGVIRILGVNHTNTTKGILFDTRYYHNQNSVLASASGHGIWNSDFGVLSGIRFAPQSASNVAIGTFRLYGIKKS